MCVHVGDVTWLSQRQTRARTPRPFENAPVRRVRASLRPRNIRTGVRTWLLRKSPYVFSELLAVIADSDQRRGHGGLEASRGHCVH